MDTISWEVLNNHINSISPSILCMGGSRGVRIGFNPKNKKLFLRLPSENNSSIAQIPFAELSTEILNDDTGSVLEISTNKVPLFSEFHRFAEIIVEIFEQPELTAFSAFNIAVQKWKDLISFKELLTKDQQLGLQGELMFLRALMEVRGPSAVSAWTGRLPDLPDRHDFRFDDTDLEIKTTKNSQRIHVIHGLEQLQPSLNHLLCLYSIRLQNAGLGVGNSLKDEIESIRSKLIHHGNELTEFELRLNNSGYRDIDAEYYNEKLILADLPVVILINDNCPRITTNFLENSISSENAGRISDVNYRVNFDGLGSVQGSKFYKELLGKIQL